MLRPRKMAGLGEVEGVVRPQGVAMHSRAFHNKRLGRIVTVRPLHDGDIDTIAALFNRLSDGARASGFHGAKPRVTPAELAQLATVGPDSHVLVAYVKRDQLPAAVARLRRSATDRYVAEIAFAVADCYQRYDIGTTLVTMLLADARAAGIVQINALVQPSNRAAVRLLRRVLDEPILQYSGLELLVSAG